MQFCTVILSYAILKILIIFYDKQKVILYIQSNLNLILDMHKKHYLYRFFLAKIVAICLLISCFSISFAECDCDSNNDKHRGIIASEITAYFNTFDLTKHDKEFYGHTIEKHTAKNKDWLDGRLSGNRHQKFASSYTNIDTATRIIKEIVLENQNKIKNWIEDQNDEKLILSKTFSEKIGIVMNKKDKEIKDCNIAIVVLKRSHRDAKKFYVVTSYPVLKIDDIDESYQNWKNKKVTN